MADVTNNSPGGGSLGSEFGPLLEFPQMPEHAGEANLKGTVGATTDLGVNEKSTLEAAEQTGEAGPASSANVDPANPKPVAPSRTLSEMSAAEVVKSHINLLLCCLYVVALEVLMAAMNKLSIEQKLTDSEGWQANKAIEREQTTEKRDAQLDAGEVAMYTCFAKAICCGVQTGVSAGCAVGGAFKGPRTATGAAIAQTGEALNGIGGSNSVFSNLAEGIGALKKSQYEAKITMLEYGIKMADEIAARLEQDRKDVSDAQNQMLQAFMQAIQTIFGFWQKG